jgi:hypothetical protein
VSGKTTSGLTKKSLTVMVAGEATMRVVVATKAAEKNPADLMEAGARIAGSMAAALMVEDLMGGLIRDLIQAHPAIVLMLATATIALLAVTSYVTQVIRLATKMATAMPTCSTAPSESGKTG